MILKRIDAFSKFKPCCGCTTQKRSPCCSCDNNSSDSTYAIMANKIFSTYTHKFRSSVHYFCYVTRARALGNSVIEQNMFDVVYFHAVIVLVLLLHTHTHTLNQFSRKSTRLNSINAQQTPPCCCTYIYLRCSVTTVERIILAMNEE